MFRRLLGAALAAALSTILTVALVPGVTASAAPAAPAAPAALADRVDRVDPDRAASVARADRRLLPRVARPGRNRFWVPTTSVSVGQRVKLAGSLRTTARRPVQIQVRRGNRWVREAATAARGRRVWRPTLTTTQPGSLKVRAVAAQVRRRGKVLPRVVLAPQVLWSAEAGAPRFDWRLVVPRARRGVDYDWTLTASGRPGLTWAVVRGSLPAGLTLDAASGAIRGAPVTAGTSTVTFRATDDLGRSGWLRRHVRVLATTRPTISGTPPDARVGASYETRVTTAGGRAGTWSVVDGSLPPGLLHDPQTGWIGGRPTTAGSFAFALRFTEVTGRTARRSFTITVT